MRVPLPPPIELRPGVAWIYALQEPGGAVRYVGKTCNPSARLGQHLRDRRGTAKVRWLQALAASGYQPELMLLECVPLSRWIAAEARWIRRLAKRFDLVNSTIAAGAGARRAGVRLRVLLSQRSYRERAPLPVLVGDWDDEHASIVERRALASAMFEAQASVFLAAQWMQVGERTVNAWLSGRHAVNLERVLCAPQLRREFIRYLAVCDRKEAA